MKKSEAESEMLPRTEVVRGSRLDKPDNDAILEIVDRFAAGNGAQRLVSAGLPERAG
jgi:hypothetical protein